MAVSWFSFIYLGLGTHVFNFLRLRTVTGNWLSFIIKFALGFGIIGNILTVMGFFNLYSSGSIMTVLVSATLISLVSFPSIIRLLSAVIFSIYNTFFLRPGFWVFFLLMIITGYMARGLLPPSGFDELMYHLSTVKLYLREGGFWNIYFNPQSDYPMLSQMHYLAALALGNDIICKGLSSLLFFIHTGMIFLISKDLSEDKNNALFSVIIFTTLPTIVANGSSCYVDIHQSLWSILAIFLLIKYNESGSKGILFTAAFCAGLAVQTKIFGIFIVPVSAVVHCYSFWINKRKFISREMMFGLLVMIVIPIAMGSLWYYKSMLFKQTIVSVKSVSLIPDKNIFPSFFSFLRDLITFPWTYTIFPSLHRADTAGPVFLMVLPFLIFVKNRNPKLHIYLLAALVFMLQLLFVDNFVIKSASGRYIIFVLALLVPMVPYTLSSLTLHKTKQILYMLVIVSVFFGGAIFFKRYNREWTALIKQKSRDEYYLSVLPEYDVIQKINRLGSDKKVLLAYNFSEYLIEIPYIVAYRRYESPREMIDDLNRKNVGYIFANNKIDTLENRFSYGEIREYMKPIYNANGFYLFELVKKR
jgi:hypothetical protein